MNHHDRILMTALLIEQWGRVRTYTLSDLVVGAWRCYPEWFSLSGYNLPNSTAVASKVQGGVGLVAKGWLTQHLDTGAYSLTVKGRVRAARVAGGVVERPHHHREDSLGALLDRPEIEVAVRTPVAPVTRPKRAPRLPRGPVVPVRPVPVRPVVVVPGPMGFMGMPGRRG